MSARNVWRAIMALAAAYAVAAMVVIVVAIVTAPSSSAEHGAFNPAATLDTSQIVSLQRAQTEWEMK